jgi:hypothetical protein
MVIDGISSRRISSYLYRWCLWWVGTAEVWSEQELLEWFLNACWVPNPAADFAAGLLHRIKKSYTGAPGFSPDFESDFVVAE